MMALMVRLWDNSRGLRQLGVLYLHNEAFLRKSIEYLTRALTLAPDDLYLLHLRGVARARFGELPLAEADWQRVLELDQRNAEPARNRADVLISKGAINDAIAILEPAAKKNPKHAQTRVSLGIAFAQTGNFASAIQHYDRAIALEPRRPSTYVYRAQALLKTGDVNRVIKDCERALGIFPDFAMAYILRGQALTNLGQRQKAAEDFRTAQEVAPDEDVANLASRALAELSSSSDNT
jgi:tetratricopeptide (TPR) repeat protein